MTPAEILVASDHSLRVAWGPSPGSILGSGAAPSAASPDDVLRLRLRAVQRLTAALVRARLPGVIDVQPAYASVLLRFDPRRVHAGALSARVADLLASLGPDAAEPPPPRTVELPVFYGGSEGPDLDEVARFAGLSVREVCERHAAARYTVAFLGFSPGFGYLVGLPPELAVPRLPTPRERVPAGSVAIAGPQAGVYPLASPGGWRLLGRTPRPLFRPEAEPATLLALGDEVRFVPARDRLLVDLAPAAAPAAAPSGPRLEVLAPGVLATVQDLGRAGVGLLGVSAGGAADPLALRLGNRLVGNAEEAAAIELTVRGGTFALPPGVPSGCSFAVTGADCAPEVLDGEHRTPVAMWTTFSVACGQRVRCGPARGGVRSYLCVAGGLAVPTVLGGAGTDLRGGFGGGFGRALRAGDTLGLAAPAITPLRSIPGPLRAHLAPGRTLHITDGAQADWFDRAVRAALVEQELVVTALSSRLGLRLQAAVPLFPRDCPGPARQLVTEGVSLGAIQVPPDGQPIVLGVDQQTTGGYPQLACVIAADLWRLGQLRPGDAVRFARVTLAEAAERLTALEALVAADLPLVTS